jgi:ABC-type glutathione transport system ATPase component
LLEETWRAHSPRSAPEGFFPKLLESVQLPAGPEFLRQRAGQLSTGQGQRLLIALAIMHKPALLIADEPISALDAITQASVLRLFQQLNQRDGTAILFISHDLLSIASISHRVEILHEDALWNRARPASYSVLRSTSSRRGWWMPCRVLHTKTADLTGSPNSKQTTVVIQSLAPCDHHPCRVGVERIKKVVQRFR